MADWTFPLNNLTFLGAYKSDFTRKPLERLTGLSVYNTLGLFSWFFKKLKTKIFYKEMTSLSPSFSHKIKGKRANRHFFFLQRALSFSKKSAKYRLLLGRRTSAYWTKILDQIPLIMRAHSRISFPKLYYYLKDISYIFSRCTKSENKSLILHSSNKLSQSLGILIRKFEFLNYEYGMDISTRATIRQLLIQLKHYNIKTLLSNSEEGLAILPLGVKIKLRSILYPRRKAPSFEKVIYYPGKINYKK
jgi:hypothetical protein